MTHTLIGSRWASGGVRQGRRERSYRDRTGATEDAASRRPARAERPVLILKRVLTSVVALRELRDQEPVTNVELRQRAQMPVPAIPRARLEVGFQARKTPCEVVL